MVPAVPAPPPPPPVAWLRPVVQELPPPAWPWLGVPAAPLAMGPHPSTLAPPPDADRIADLAVALYRGQISCPDDFLYEPIERATLELRIRAARRTLAVRAALRQEQDELRLLASGLATENRRLQRLAPAEALADLPNRSEAIERRD